MSGRRICIDCYSPFYRCALTEEGKLTELILQEKEDKPKAGDIFVGRVEKILPSHIAFVNIGDDKPVFLQLNDRAEEENTRGLKTGQEIIVQIAKEAYDEKCAVATTNIGVTGKYCVAVKDRGDIGISRKITDDNIRSRLKAIAEKHKKDGFSFVMRTSCGSEEYGAIEKEIEEALVLIEEIEKRGKFTKAPALIYRELSPLYKIIRDLGDDNCEIIVNDREHYEKIREKYGNIQLYSEKVPMFMNYGIESQIEKLFHRRIWLDCGGYIVIDETEAMTVIDVNSGKSSKIKDNYIINKEAAIEAARQIRLRNLNGMIIIDFINMKDKEDNKRLCSVLKEELNRDRVKSFIVGMTELGLMQITRQKQRKPLSRYIYHKCPMCDGLGRVKDVCCLADSINNQVITLALTTIYNKIKISSNSTVIEALEEGRRRIEDSFDISIELEKINTSRFDYYEIEKSRI